MRRGITHMLPTEDAAWVGEELTRRFGAAVLAVRPVGDRRQPLVAPPRPPHHRPLKVVVHDHCYHGSVDEAIAMLDEDGSGRVVPVRGSVGPQVDVAETTRVVEFNDVAGLEAALADGDVAAVLVEPALTNVGIVLPEPGYLEAMREITRRTGTILIIDETHTICAGPAARPALWDLHPTCSSSARRSAAASRRGLRVQRGGRAAGRAARSTVEDSDVGGIGGTLAGYALSLAATRATLGEVLTDEAFERMIPLAERWEAGVNDVLARARRAVARHPARRPAEYHFMPDPAADRRRAVGARRLRARAVPPPLGDEPARPDDAVPQHGADVAGHHRGRRRPPHRGLRGGRRGALRRLGRSPG